jgi:endonuclease/exonuclease/phosphatase (EEP) superfamily protein YafD
MILEGSAEDLFALAGYCRGYELGKSTINNSLIGSLICTIGVLAALMSVAGYFGKNGWLLDLCSEFRIPYVYLFMALCAACFLNKRKLFGAFFACALLMNAVTIFGIEMQSAHALPSSGIPFRVVQTNLWVRNHDFARLAAFIINSRADVIGIEEYSVDAAKDFERLGVFQSYPHHVSIPSSDCNSEIVLLSRRPLSNIRISESSALHDRTLLADIRVAAHDITIVVMHPCPPMRQTLYDRACQQFKTTAALRGTMKPRVIVIGDLNTTQFSWKFDAFAKAMNVVDTRRGHGPSPTWLVWLPVLPIDFVLTSPEIFVRQFEVAPPTGSDHSPVITDLVI